MNATIINLIIQLVAGAGGSSILANAASRLNLGPLGNLITGALGGIGGGNLLGALLHGGGAAAANAATGGFDLGSLVTQLIGGGVGGPIVTAIVAMIRNAMSGQKTV
jgi:hypothetical protein